MRGSVKIFKVKGRNKDKNNKLMSSHRDDKNLLEKYNAIKYNPKNFELNALPVYGDKYVKTKIKTYPNKVYPNFCGLNIAEDDIEFIYSHVYGI